ncbi:MAG: ribonuclease Z [bacterium]
MELIVLGSGGFMPQPGHYMPAFLVGYEGQSYLFDCGEWTQVRMVEAGRSAASLSSVVISHMHGDHVLGLPGLLIRKSRESPENGSLSIAGPNALREYLSSNQSSLGYELKVNVDWTDLEAESTLWVDQFKLTAHPLDHRTSTFGFSFVLNREKRKFNPEKARELGVPEGPLRSRLQQGETVTLDSGTVIEPEQVSKPRSPGPKFVYLTDTRPIYNLPEAFHEPDLLVHEAMFKAEHKQHAREKKHSTAREAARVASHLKADKLLLTHISQRYEAHEHLRDEARQVFTETFLARDGQRHEI